MLDKSKTRETGKRVALAVLAVLCVWLVYRNLVAPFASTGASSPPDISTATAGKSQGQSRDGRATGLNQQELSDLDPTLRLDLLDNSRQSQYTGTYRNIFQLYTPPPPKPVVSPITQPSVQPPTTVAAPPPTIPLKFYGIASRAGSPDKKAFLTEGDDIFIGQEGDTIDKNYKITRIGLTSIELEDIRTKQKHQLQLVQE